MLANLQSKCEHRGTCRPFVLDMGVSQDGCSFWLVFEGKPIGQHFGAQRLTAGVEPLNTCQEGGFLSQMGVSFIKLAPQMVGIPFSFALKTTKRSTLKKRHPLDLALFFFLPRPVRAVRMVYDVQKGDAFRLRGEDSAAYPVDVLKACG